jgi:hypothetical protein
VVDEETGQVMVEAKPSSVFISGTIDIHQHREIIRELSRVVLRQTQILPEEVDYV